LQKLIVCSNLCIVLDGSSEAPSLAEFSTTSKAAVSAPATLGDEKYVKGAVNIGFYDVGHEARDIQFSKPKAVQLDYTIPPSSKNLASGQRMNAVDSVQPAQDDFLRGACLEESILLFKKNSRIFFFF
jgi:hypothetical protein